jgi:hypothetical protein
VSGVAVVAAAMLAAPYLEASGPTFWTTATPAEFLRGTSDGVFVSLTGTLTAGPELTSRLTSTPAQVWSVAQAADGSLWAGTGGDGRVIRIRTGQPEQTVFDAPEANVFAVAIAGSTGTVYAATGPDGQVYAIDATGAAKPFFNPDEKYIWALAVDNAGRVWVGAGNPAVIYRVEPSGTSTTVYKPAAAHVVTLGLDPSGRMLAGTESPGRLYRFDQSDRPFVLLDSGLTELRAVSADASGVVFAAGVAKGDEPAAGGNETASVTAVLAAPSPATGGSSSSGSSSSGGTTTQAPRRSALFRIDRDGTWEEIWATPDVIYDIDAEPDGVLVATGPVGRLFKVDDTRDVSLLTGVDAKQITRFATGGRPRSLAAFATANPGRVVSLGARRQPQATYISSVRDTRSVSTWGLIRWEAQGTVAVSTRSGNTEKPDDSWSDWSPGYSKPTGDAVTSPAARFIQWRAVLTSTAASPSVLNTVTVAYLMRNTRPVVSSLTVHPPGVVFQRPYVADDAAIAGLDQSAAEARRPPGDTPPTPQPGRRMFQRGLQTITWKADDDDSDRLTYALEYRRQGDASWHDLKDGLTDGIFVWDTASVADGRYTIRVSASDSPSNAGDRALAGDRESELIDVDNTPPMFTTEVVRRGADIRLVVRVHDARSPIAKVEYSIGDGSWQLLYPTDGLADAPDETFEVPLAAEGDAARVVIRATDTMQNVMSQAVR